MNYPYLLWDVHAGDAHPFNALAEQIDNGTGRPSPERYYDRAFAAREFEQVFAKSWLIACPVSDVKEPGDFARFDVGSESFIIVRGDDDVIRAHYNVCPHRGSQLVGADTGCITRFSCPFHSWKFSLEGKNEEAP
jgi:phenylpropionate dioxygenase-like ring-hydroxylating dioxygenase large terminal subunit